MAGIPRLRSSIAFLVLREYVKEIEFSIRYQSSGFVFLRDVETTIRLLWHLKVVSQSFLCLCHQGEKDVNSLCARFLTV
ncbi:hypothetical protein OS493_015052 [Desmophyllum pertusum]|uniref:Uncharacterized protein n=1 Tax=Desmophyllum pertusum TaxID=174260 RepID=A0A9X0D342_9CNID|nr:hypothetical protein OS493_015052 [Desmophyllum pertusum]